MEVLLCNDTDWLLSEEAFGIYSSCMYKPTYENFKQQMKLYISDTSIKIFVCNSDCEKIGLLILNQSDFVPEIEGIAVSEEYRSLGNGKNMIISVMESEHLRDIKAQTDDETIDFYRKCGFDVERVVIEYPDGISVRYNCFYTK